MTLWGPVALWALASMVPLGCSPPPPSTNPAATLAIVNARVWTGNADQPWAEAVAVRDEKIAAVGTEDEIRPSSARGPK